MIASPSSTAIRMSKNVPRYAFGSGAVGGLDEVLAQRRGPKGARAVFCVDAYFRNKALLRSLPIRPKDDLLYVDTALEPTTTQVDALLSAIKRRKGLPCAVVGVGGGSTLDIAKALSNLLTNGGKAEAYQGWDLVKKPGVFKVGVPTLSGTGAEASRTCVMINPRNGLKLGMNSDHTIFDLLLLDPALTRTVPKDQYFFTGMDTYVHCIESLGGRYRNAIGDAFSHQALDLCRQVFLSADMRADEAREKLMIASYLGGCALANSFVGVVHPFSAGLSVVLGIHHGKANCIAMTALDEFYPKETAQFRAMASRQGIEIPQGLCRDLPEDQYELLYRSTIVHEKPLSNALGPEFKSILTPQKVKAVFRRM